MKRVFGTLKKIHFIGIGGIGMSGIAEVLHGMGFEISGSDMSENSNTKRLALKGMTIYKGHAVSNIKDVDVIVYTSAIPVDNVEYQTAKDSHIPLIKRGEMLAELMRLKYAVAVGGSHGKTTTTSMISELTNDAGLDPTILIGGRLNSIDSNALYGKSNIMIAEADESDRSFLMLYPSVVVITNIDNEHMESYQDIDDLKICFTDFANKVPFYGVVILCLDDPNLADIIPNVTKRMITYGLKTQADIRAVDIKKEGFGVAYDVVQGDVRLGRIKLKLPGDHIVLNSLAVIATALEMGIDFKVIKKSLAKFEGVQRRMTIRYEDTDFTVIDDYGHHPTEISTTLKAIKEALPESKIVIIFEPHRYSRTEALMSEFGKCFMDADALYITDIYPASEKPIEGIDTHRLIKEIKKYGFKDISYLEKVSDFYSHLKRDKAKHTTIVTFGAGVITKFSVELSNKLGSFE